MKIFHVFAALSLTLQTTHVVASELQSTCADTFGKKLSSETSNIKEEGAEVNGSQVTEVELEDEDDSSARRFLRLAAAGTGLCKPKLPEVDGSDCTPGEPKTENSPFCSYSKSGDPIDTGSCEWIGARSCVDPGAKKSKEVCKTYTVGGSVSVEFEVIEVESSWEYSGTVCETIEIDNTNGKETKCGRPYACKSCTKQKWACRSFAGICYEYSECCDNPPTSGVAVCPKRQ